MLTRNSLQANRFPPPPPTYGIYVGDKTSKDIASLIESLEIRNFIVSPGHEFLDEYQIEIPPPSQIRVPVEKNPAPIIVNGILNVDQSILEYVDIWDGHHRLKYFLKIQPDITLADERIALTQAVVVLVDGKVVRPSKSSHRNDREGDMCAHWLPLWGIFLGDEAVLSDLSKNRIHHQLAKEYTVASFPNDGVGPPSNVFLGSRTTLLSMNNTSLRFEEGTLPQRRCDSMIVYYGSFDPIHRGDQHAMSQLLQNFPQSYLLLVPLNTTSAEHSIEQFHHQETMIEMIVNELNNSEDRVRQGRIKVLLGMTPYRSAESQRLILLKSISQYMCIPVEAMYHVSSVVKYESTGCGDIPLHRELVLEPCVAVTSKLSIRHVIDYIDPWMITEQQIRAWIRSFYTIPDVQGDFEGLLRIVLRPQVLEYIISNRLYSSRL